MGKIGSLWIRRWTIRRWASGSKEMMMNCKSKWTVSRCSYVVWLDYHLWISFLWLELARRSYSWPKPTMLLMDWFDQCLWLSMMDDVIQRSTRKTPLHFHSKEHDRLPSLDRCWSVMMDRCIRSCEHRAIALDRTLVFAEKHYLQENRDAWSYFPSFQINHCQQCHAKLKWYSFDSFFYLNWSDLVGSSLVWLETVLNQLAALQQR